MEDPTGWARVHRRKRDEKKQRKQHRRSPQHCTALRQVPREHEGHGACISCLNLADDLVTVSVPFWNTPPGVVERAVSSVLSGTHTHLRAVLISDGESTHGRGALSSELLADPRVVTVASPHNRGPYFNHDVVLSSAEGTFFAVQDSDDFSHRIRFQRQLDTLHRARAEAVHSPIYEVQLNGTRRVVRGSVERPLQWGHYADHFGLYGVDALNLIGGYYAGFRVGYDSNLTGMLNLLARTCMTKESLYTRVLRSSSLSRSRETGFGSTMRTAEQQQLRGMWYRIQTASDRVSRAEALEKARSIAWSRVSSSDRKQKESLLERVRLACRERPLDVPPLNQGQLNRGLASLPVTDWSISIALATEIFRFCEVARPKKVLDVGSGLSTMALALYAARYDAQVISLEHDRSWYETTKKALAKFGLTSHTRLVHAPLARSSGVHWYGVSPGTVFDGGKIDFAFVDGPPSGSASRGGMVTVLGKALGRGSVLWLHDGRRPAESDVARKWAADLGARLELDTKSDSRGVWKLVVP